MEIKLFIQRYNIFLYIFSLILISLFINQYYAYQGVLPVDSFSTFNSRHRSRIHTPGVGSADGNRRRTDRNANARSTRKMATKHAARDLAQLSGHSEADCREVLAQCDGDIDRAVDKLLNSAYSRDDATTIQTTDASVHGVVVEASVGADFLF